MRKTIITMSTGLMLVAFNQYDNTSGDQPEMGVVNEASRISHAKELLGSRYYGSLAQKMEGAIDLNLSIYHKVQTYLPAKYKGQARKVSQFLISESGRQQLDPVFVMAVIQTESRFNPLARGTSGEIGLMQLKPATAAWIAQKYKITWKGAKSLENPITNIRLGIAYMKHLHRQFEGSSNRYVSAYNMGAKKVRRMVASQNQPEIYSSKVMGHYRNLYMKMAAHKEVAARGFASTFQVFSQGLHRGTRNSAQAENRLPFIY